MNDRPKPTKSLEQQLHPEPVLPRVTIPRDMLEDTPPSPFEQIRAAIHARQAAELDAWNDAHPGRHTFPYDREIDARRPQADGRHRATECTCDHTPPELWTTHYGAIEPGSTMEWNPECPVHRRA